LKVKKKFGQHFLKDTNLLKKIANLAEIKPGDKIWEIGPGRGSLTRELLKQDCQLTIFEIDQDLYPYLKQKFDDHARIIPKDILKCSWEDYLPKDKIKLVSNLPYQITSPLLFRLIDFRDRFTLIVLMLQKEVAQRLNAVAGSREYGFLSIRIQFYFRIKYEFTVKRHLFLPAPRVDSAVVTLKPEQKYKEPLNSVLFWKVVKSTFAKRRKTLRNNLKSIFSETILTEFTKKTSFDLSRRGETFKIEEFISLFNELSELI